ncbi:hypothetical protein [Bacillus sp. V5-8f]|nr:hypothetical protein [Bacillus sp. V5-8f]
MSKLVNTVLGPVSADELGKTLMHEHFFFQVIMPTRSMLLTEMRSFELV